MSRFGVVLAVLEALLDAILAVWRPTRAPESNFRGGRFSDDAREEGGGSALENSKKNPGGTREAFKHAQRAEGTVADYFHLREASP